MPVTTVFVSGPPRSGKTRLIEAIASMLLTEDPPHHVRLLHDESCTGVQVHPAPSADGVRFRGSWRVPYTADLAFEILPEAIHRVRNRTKYVTMFLEADVDHSLRYAFSYTHRIFTMAAPDRIRDVFRSSTQAARALREVMGDTATFASEIFGVLGSEPLDEAEGVKVSSLRVDARPPEHRIEISASQMRRFLNSPLGAEIVSRVQLQPDYHSLVENDVIIINTSRVADDAVVDQCVRSLGSMLNRVREGTGRHRELFACDPADPNDPRTGHLMARLGELLTSQT